MINLIVAMNQDGVIGIDNSLPWHIPEDLKYFKQITKNKTVVMGRKTFESIGKILPNRRNVIITNQKDYYQDDCIIYNNLKTCLKAESLLNDVFIIGGSEIFSQSIGLGLINALYITHVNIIINGDNLKYFPKIDLNKFNKISSKKIVSEDGLELDFCVYE